MSTSEGRNVVTKPFDCGSLIAKPSVLFNAWRSREAEDTQAVVDCHDYYILVICKILAVVIWAVWSGNSEAAAMEECEDGLLGFVRMRFRSRLGPDVECETVFVLLIPEATSEFFNDIQAIVGKTGELSLWSNVRWAIAIGHISKTPFYSSIATYALCDDCQSLALGQKCYKHSPSSKHYTHYSPKRCIFPEERISAHQQAPGRI